VGPNPRTRSPQEHALPRSPIERPLRHASERRAHCRVERLSFAHRPRVQHLGVRVLPLVRLGSDARAGVDTSSPWGAVVRALLTTTSKPTERARAVCCLWCEAATPVATPKACRGCCLRANPAGHAGPCRRERAARRIQGPRGRAANPGVGYVDRSANRAGRRFGCRASRRLRAASGLLPLPDRDEMRQTRCAGATRRRPRAGRRGGREPG
jgi:hypothetical protein